MVATVGQELLTTRSRELKELVAKTDHASVMQRTTPSNMKDFRKYNWVPASLKASARMPENTSSFALPWLFHNVKASSRYGWDVWPAIGCGGFFMPLEGKAMLIMWPMSAPASINVKYDQALGFYGQMAKDQFQKFWDSDVYHCLLEGTEAAWIPYGYAVVAVALADEAFTALWLPYSSTNMLEEVPDSVVQHMMEATQIVLDNEDLPPDSLFKRVSPAYMQWLTASVEGRGPERTEGGSDDEALLPPAPSAASDSQGSHKRPASVHGASPRPAKKAATSAASADQDPDAQDPAYAHADTGSDTKDGEDDLQ